MNGRNRVQQIKDLYNAALDRNPVEREAFLAEACAGDDELRREVESLLAYETRAEEFIEKPALQVAAENLTEEVTVENLAPIVGAKFGSYQVISPLGAGGMGEVYLAKDERLGRRVALKLLPLRFTTEPERVRRFEQEARAASSLNHPNIVTVYDLGQTPIEAGAQRFIATEFIDGETLRVRLAGGRLKLETAIDIAVQVAAALVAAHEAGIIHRDIKPENLMLRRDRYVKVLDFGLAKLTEFRISDLGLRIGESAAVSLDDLSNPQSAIHNPQSNDPQSSILNPQLTSPGVIMGTATYMSPEQARGIEVDARTDIFSLGVVFYEMIAGRAPFTGSTASDVIAQILTAEPLALSELVPEIPPEPQSIVSRALAKDRDRRYSSAEAMFSDLSRLRDELSFAAKLKLQDSASGQKKEPRPAAPSLNSRIWMITGAGLLLVIAGLWLAVHLNNRDWAYKQVSRIEQLADAQKHFEAYDLALEALKYIPHNQDLESLMPTISDKITVTTEPAGAKVFLKRFTTGSPPRELIGETPLNGLRVARGEYLLQIEREGFAPFERTVSSKLYHWGTAMLPPDEPTVIHQKLIEAGKLPSRMVFIPGGDYKLVSWDKPTDASVKLDDYFLDKYEVTNREYKEFVSAGGYLNRSFWKGPFVKGGRRIEWKAAMLDFKDRTGLPGPRQWVGQNYSEGQADFPVTGVTWAEAAAYAVFRGKQLPTIFQWEKAARNGLFTYYSAIIMPWGPIDVSSSVDGRANFKSDGPRPVGSFEFGMSPFGCHDLAGNVAEWCLNETDQGFVTAGASWDDLSYLFGYIGGLPANHSSNKLGFRCVLNPPDSKSDQGAKKIDPSAGAPSYRATTDPEFRSLLTHYRYDRTPLDPQVIETIETPDWRREKITYLGARDERVIAYLYLPKNFPPPFQVLQFVPAGDVYGGYLTMTESLEMVLPPQIKAGRAVFAVVFKGFKERENQSVAAPPSASSVKRRQEVVANSIDLRRGLDYLATRQEIDAARICYFGYSQGATEGLIYAALDERYRAVVMVAGGMWPPGPNWLPEISHPNFAAHIRAPKLLINGRYDEVHSLKRMIEPLYQLLRQPKKLILYDGSHSPPIEIEAPAVNGWLDETFGPVRR